MLSLAIALTGISFSDTTTANAATDDEYVLKCLACHNRCGEEFDAKDYDVHNNGIVDSADIDAAFYAMEEHKTENKHGTGSISEIVGYANPKEVTIKATRCKLCNQTEEQIKNAGQ